MCPYKACNFLFIHYTIYTYRKWRQCNNNCFVIVRDGGLHVIWKGLLDTFGPIKVSRTRFVCKWYIPIRRWFFLVSWLKVLSKISRLKQTWDIITLSMLVLVYEQSKHLIVHSIIKLVTCLITQKSIRKYFNFFKKHDKQQFLVIYIFFSRLWLNR